MTSKYQALLAEWNLITQLERASSCLEYDKMVFMPSTERASSERGKQSAALAAVIHEKATSTNLGLLLDEAQFELENTERDWEKIRNLDLARKEFRKRTSIPKELETQRAELSAESYTKWAKAREADDYSIFQDVFARCIDLGIEIAKCKRRGEDDEKDTYAIMLDEYETGMDPARIDDIFQEIKTALVPLIDRVLGPDASSPATKCLEGVFPVDKQKDLCLQIVRDLGYDVDSGRFDVSVHPFSMSLNPADVRITSRFRDNDWYQGLAGTIHESGHAMYEQNIGGEGRPMDGALSMGMHESQSLFWERHIGLCRSFWTYAAPLVNEKFGVDYTADEYYGAVNHVQRSYIRVEADELTYPLHVILRYEIERDFIAGKLQPADIPARWNADFEKMLGIKVPSDAKGCLQDIHWSLITYGYFPTYLLGSATAAQLCHFCRKDIPDMDAKIAKGDFGEIKAWLTEKIHRHGKRYLSLDEHLEAQLGEKLNPKYFIHYLADKYTDLYKV